MAVIRSQALCLLERLAAQCIGRTHWGLSQVGSFYSINCNLKLSKGKV